MPVQPGFSRRNPNQVPYSMTVGKDGKVVEQVLSPWQQMIYDARLAANPPLSQDSVAKMIEARPATFHSWVTKRAGGPPVRTYTTQLNNRIASALGLNPEALSAAYRESVLGSKEVPPAPSPISPWQTKIRQAVEASNLRDIEVANALGVHLSTIRNWMEKYAGGPPVTRYDARLNEKIARLLKLDADELMELYKGSVFNLFGPDPEAPAPRGETVPSRAPVSRKPSRSIVLREEPPAHSEAPVDYLASFMTHLRETGRPAYTLAQLEDTAAETWTAAGAPPKVDYLDLLMQRLRAADKRAFTMAQIEDQAAEVWTS